MCVGYELHEYTNLFNIGNKKICESRASGKR